jgi:integrase
MVFLRRTYNYAHKRRLDPNLPHFNPVDSIDMNPSARRDTAMAASELADWYGKLRQLPNAVRQEFHLFCLLSGSRPSVLTVARWEHLDVKRRVLHIPKPKGGTKRAFDMPLSRAMLACLARARRAGRIANAVNAAEWVFPGDMGRSRRKGGPLSAGHIVEYREDREALPKWGGDLRQTYKTLSPEAGLSKTDVMMLMNHADGDVNDGYMTRSKVAEDYLRAQQEAMSRYLMSALERG